MDSDVGCGAAVNAGVPHTSLRTDRQAEGAEGRPQPQSPNIRRIIFPDLYPKQHEAFFGPERIIVTEASTKSGKSVGAMTWQQHEAINVSPGCAHIWTSPVYPQAHAQVERLARWYAKMDPEKQTGWSYNRTELSFTVPGGSKIWFKGSDNPDSIYGTDYSSAVIDEASRCKEDAFYAVRSTTTATRAPIRIIGNVKGRKNWAYRLGRKAAAGEPGMRYCKITAADAVAAGVLDAEEIENARRDLPEAIFRELYMAEASDDQGNPFGMDAIRECANGLWTSEPVVWGWDLGKSVDWTVGIGLDYAGHVCRFERFQKPWNDTIDTIARLSKCKVKLDSTGVGDPVLEALQRKGVDIEGIVFTSRSKQQLMEGLAVALQARALSYPEGPIRSELEAFEYEYTRTGVRYSAPEGMHDDCVCALALAVSGLTFGLAPVRVEDFHVSAVVSDRERFDW